MIKSKLYTFLKEYLGEYLYGLQEDQLDVALLSGVINFSNANFRPDRVNALFADQNLPFTLKAGLIGSLQVKYHYSSLLSNPVEVTIDTLLLVLGPLLCQVIEPDTRFMESSLAEDNIPPDKIFLKRFARDKRKKECESSGSEALSGEDGEDEFPSQDSMTDSPSKAAALFKELADAPGDKHEGLLARYFTKVLKNLTLKVTNVHIRYEDDTYLYNNPFSCGLCLKSLSVKTSPQEWVFTNEDSQQVTKQAPKRGAIAKEVVLAGCSVYLAPLSSMLIPTSLWEATQASPIGIFDALPAYEVRELAIQEAESIISEGSHTLISPLATTFTITLDTDAPKVKACIPFPKQVEVRITAAMIDTARGFLDYRTNVKLWPIMRRYRPFERVLLIHRTEDEPDFVTAKRKRIVRKWFIYACRFIQAKRKILELINRKTRQISREKQEMRKKERYVRPADVESSVEVTSSFFIDESGLRTDSPEPTSLIPKNGKKTMSFLIPRPRRVPGLSTINLSAAVNEYNKSLLTSPVHRSPRQARHAPAKPVPAHFKPPFNSVEVDCRAVEIVVTVADEVLDMRCALEKVGVNLKIEGDTLKKKVGVGLVNVVLRDAHEESVLFHLGKKEVLRDEPVKGGLFSRNQKRTVVVEPADPALNFRVTYIPSAFRAPGEMHPSAKMYEIAGNTGQLGLTYSHSVLMQVIDLMAAFQQPCGSESEEVVRDIERKRTFQLNFKERMIKKDRKVRHASALLAFASDAIAKKILLLKTRLQRDLKDADEFIDPINFSVKVDFGGLDLSLMDRGSSSSDLYLPAGKFEFEKVESKLKALLWGFGVTTVSSLTALEQFLGVIQT